MKKLVAICLTLALLAGCGAGTPPGDRMLTDGAGRTVALPDSVERVVCVGVGALRYTCYLGGAPLVVGVEDYETETSLSRLYNYVNREHFQKLPTIGGNGQPDAEAILAADPQVIILSAYAGSEAEQLQSRTGIPVVVIPGSDSTLDDKSYETVRILGELLGREDRARELTAYLQAMEQGLRDRTAQAEHHPTCYVAGMSFKGFHGFEGTEAGYGPLALLGASNLADTTGQTGAFDVDLEQVLTWDPEVILLDYDGLPLIRDHYRENPTYYDELTALREGRVYAQIPFRSYAANLETALADAWYAGSVLYPAEFADVDVEQQTREIFTMLLGADPYDDLKEAGYGFDSIELG